MKRKSALPLPATEAEKAVLDVSAHDARRALEQDASQREAEASRRIDEVCRELNVHVEAVCFMSMSGGVQLSSKVVANR